VEYTCPRLAYRTGFITLTGSCTGDPVSNHDLIKFSHALMFYLKEATGLHDLI
jgi:hypothetical protein